MSNLPHGGKTWCPWPHDPPEGWPYEYVARVDFTAMIDEIDATAEKHLRNADAEIAELKALLRDAVASHNKHCICMACEYVKRPEEYRENKA